MYLCTIVQSQKQNKLGNADKIKYCRRNIIHIVCFCFTNKADSDSVVHIYIFSRNVFAINDDVRIKYLITIINY